MENLARTSLIDYRTISYNFFEKLYWEKELLVCGLDEVGRGPLAGPIVAAAVSLNNNSVSPLIQDSKTLSEKKLLQAFNWINQNSTWSIGIIDHNFIDTYSIVQANELVFKRALSLLMYKLKKPLSGVIIDAVRLDLSKAFDGPVHVFYKAELLSISVAAASIVAKVYRDRLMNRYDELFKGYFLDQHKGYATKKHYNALDLKSQSTIHRKSFLKRYLHAAGKQ